MDPSNRTKEALIARTESLCTSISDIRQTDPWAGTGHLSTILRTVQMADSSAYANVPRLEGVHDYATSAQREGRIREQSCALVRATQEIGVLIRDLQELWLFGRLDTLGVGGEGGGRDGGGSGEDGERDMDREKVVAVVRLVEGLAGGKVVREVSKEKEKGEGENKKEEKDA